MTTLSAIALNGYNGAVARVADATQNIVNASSTSSADLAGSIVELTTAKLQADIGVKLLKIDNELQKSLINILT